MGEKMTHEEMCKEFCELNGIVYIPNYYTTENVNHGYMNTGYRNHPFSPTVAIYHEEPHNFKDAKSILEIIDKRQDNKLFYANLIYSGNVEEIDDDGLIPREYVMDSGKLLSTALEWCREHPIK